MNGPRECETSVPSRIHRVPNGNASAVRLRGTRSATSDRPPRLIQFTRVLGLMFVAGGFAAIGVGWNEIAQMTCVDCQLPYVLSAGGAGLGLVVLGVGLLVIAQLRAERWHLLSGLEHLAASRETPAEADPTMSHEPDRNGRGSEHRLVGPRAEPGGS